MSVIVIEGNIGSGKTTFCNNLFKLLNRLGLSTKQYPENVPWDQLQEFLKNQDNPEIVEKFQKCMYRLRYETIKRSELVDSEISIIDRGEVGNMTFARTHIQNNMINESTWISFIKSINNNIEPEDSTFLLYLRVSVDNCMDRIRRRSRENEDLYSREYIESLHNNLEDLFNEYKGNKMVIDWNIGLDDSNNIFRSINDKFTSIDVIKSISKLQKVIDVRL